jgi:hypothetical protein
MRLELINQSLKVILPEDLLQVVLKLQDLRAPVSNYVNGLDKKCEFGVNEADESLKVERANDVISHINSAIADMADLLSLELAEKIIENNNL